MSNKTTLGFVAFGVAGVLGYILLADPKKAHAKSRAFAPLPFDDDDDEDEDEDEEPPALTLDDIPDEDDPIGDVEIGEITIETPSGIERQIVPEDVPLAVPVVRPVAPQPTPTLPQDIVATPPAVAPRKAPAPVEKVITPPVNLPAAVEDVIKIEHPDGTVEKLDPAVALAPEADETAEVLPTTEPEAVAPPVVIAPPVAPPVVIEPPPIAIAPPIAPPVVIAPPVAPPVVIEPPTPPAVIEPKTQVAQEDVEAVTTMAKDTAAVIQEMLDDEKGAQWKRRYSSLETWQGKRGLVADGMFGPTSALNMAEETGLLPIIRFWPRAAVEGKADAALRRAYRTEAATADEPRAAQLVAAADREQGQGFGRPQSAITPTIEI